MNGNITRPLGKISLPVTFGGPENFRTEEIVFDIADTPLPYNGIFMAVSHFAYNMLKIPAAWGVIRVKADMDDAIYCVQKLNQTVATTANTRQDAQDAGADATLGGGGSPGGSAPAASKRAPFRGDPQMTKKVALMSDV